MVKKKGFFIFIFLLAGVLLSGCSGSNTGGSADTNKENESTSNEVIELNINNWAASTHHYAYNVYEPWKEIVEEKTDGRVKVNIYHGSSLGKSTSVYQDVSGGLYDVGLVIANYFYDTSFFPYTIGNLPFAFEGPTEAANVLQKFGEKYAHEDLSDVIVMNATSTDGYDLFSTKPINKVEDLNKLKMRINGKSETEFVKSLGGVPVNITTEDTYEGLQKGNIETAFYTPIGAVGLKFFEPAPYITKLGVSVTPVIPIMNKEFYESLPDDLKTLFDEELNPKLTELFTESYETELEASYEELEKGVDGRGEMITLSDEEMAKFKPLAEGSWQAWIEDANAKGYDGEKMVEDLFSMLEEAGYPTPY